MISRIGLFSGKAPNLLRSLAINTASMSLSQVLRVALNVLLSLLVANKLGANGLGKYAILTAFVVLVQELAYAGLPRLIVREVARHPEQTSTWFARSTINQLLAGMAGTIILWSSSNFLNYDADLLQAFRIAAFCLIPSTFASTAEAFLQARERMHLIALTQLAGRGTQLVGSVVLLFMGYGIQALAAMIVVSQAAAAVTGLLALRSLQVWRAFRLEWQSSLLLFRQAAEFNLLQISVIAYNKLDVLVLSMVADATVVGFYNAAWLVIQLINTVSTGFSSAIYPILSRHYVESKTHFKEFVLRSIGFGTLLSTIATVTVIILAPFLISIPFHDEKYQASVPLLRLLAPFLVISMGNAIMANSLFASNQQRQSVMVATIKLAFGLVIYWILVERYTDVGAAVATVTTGLIGTFLNAYFVFNSMRKQR